MDVGISWNLGLRLIRLKRVDRKIQYFKLQKNSGYKNLERFPFIFQLLGNIDVEPMQWTSLIDFQGWLEESFGGQKYPDGQYYLWGKRSSLKYVLKWHFGHKKRYQPVRPWTSFAKFSVVDGSVEFSIKENKGRRCLLMFKQDEINFERQRRLRFDKR
jgi:hypothetical protein